METQYISIPNKYIDNPIIEKLPPLPQKGVSGRPFFESPESHSVCYENNKFMIRKNKKELIPLEIGMKGYCCVGCEPGSFPQPIMIAHINNDTKEVGLIIPFIYKLKETDDEVELKIGSDMSLILFEKILRENKIYDELLFTYEKNPEIYKQSDEYKILYIHKDYALSVNLCLSVGTFGNIDLPSLNSNIPYNFLF